LPYRIWFPANKDILSVNIRTVYNDDKHEMMPRYGKVTSFLNYISAPSDINVPVKDDGKVHKCKDILTEVRCTWNLKLKMTAVIIDVTGSLYKSIQKYLKFISRKHSKRSFGKCAHFTNGKRKSPVIARYQNTNHTYTEDK
jgi:hypothetical protein